MNAVERRFEALVRAVKLMRRTFLRMRAAVEAGEVAEINIRLSKQGIINICQWDYGWPMLRDKLMDKYGLCYMAAERNYAFKANILTEIVAGTTYLLPDEADEFLYLLVHEGETGQPQTRKRLSGVASSMALVAARDYGEAKEYLKSLGTYAEEVKQAQKLIGRTGWTARTILAAEPEEILDALRGDLEEDEYDYGQGDPFAREGDIEDEDEDREPTQEELWEVEREMQRHPDDYKLEVDGKAYDYGPPSGRQGGSRVG